MMIGYGLAFSFTAVYLGFLPRVGTQGVGIYFAALGASGVAVGMLMSTAIGRIPPRPMCSLAVLIAVASFLTFPTVDSTLGVVGVAAGLGAATALFQAAIVPLLQAVTQPQHLRLAFAMRYQTANVALAIGVGIAGYLIDHHGIMIMRPLFIVAAIAHIPLLGLLLLRPMWPGLKTPPQESKSEGDRRPNTIGLLRRVGPLIILQASSGLLVFPHLEVNPAPRRGHP